MSPPTRSPRGDGGDGDGSALPFPSCISKEARFVNIEKIKPQARNSLHCDRSSYLWPAKKGEQRSKVRIHPMNMKRTQTNEHRQADVVVITGATAGVGRATVR